MAAIHVAGVLCDPCGAMQRIAPQGSQRTPATCIAATTPELTVGILKFSVLNFKKFLKFKNFLNF